MRVLKRRVLAVIIALPCMLWMVIGYSPHLPALHGDIQILKLFQQQPISARNACVTTVQQCVETSNSSLLVLTDAPILNCQVTNTIKKFILFIGSARSGHSIVGSLMDAHPHVIISHEYNIFRNWQQFHNISNQNWTKTLFNLLYNKSSSDVSGIRNSLSKGYSLKVDNLWQGKFDCHLEVIGDKCAESLCHEYLKNKYLFKIRFKTLQNKLLNPIRAIHVIRNPFDQIATRSFYILSRNDLAVSKLKHTLEARQGLRDYKFRRDDIATRATLHLFNVHQASLELIELLGKINVLEVHSSDFINNPKATLSRIFEFLEVDASEHYLEVCADKVYKSTSRTRELMFWPPSIKHMVEEKMKRYEFLSRYNFTNN